MLKPINTSTLVVLFYGFLLLTNTDATGNSSCGGLKNVYYGWNNAER